MKKMSLIKIQYALYTPIVRIVTRLKGVDNQGGNFWCGFPYISKLKQSEIRIGKRCRFASKTTSNPLGINHRCMISTLSKGAIIDIGDNCSFSGISISCTSSVKIGNGARFGANVTIMDHDGHWDDFRSGRPRSILIEDSVWIGSNVIILKDVKIGRYAMIGAGSVVRNNVPPYAIVTGNPAKIVGFSKTPEEIIEFEKTIYPDIDRLTIEVLNKNYNKFFINRLDDIKKITRL